jgi:hypothetical protein
MAAQRVWLTVVAAALSASQATAVNKPKRPIVEVRVAPQSAPSLTSILFIAELKGGDDPEDFYCPRLEWDWGDGTDSTFEEDCEPFGPGTRLQRRFTAEHVYADQGKYTVKISLVHRKEVVARAETVARVLARPGEDIGAPSRITVRTPTPVPTFP